MRGGHPDGRPFFRNLPRSCRGHQGSLRIAGPDAGGRAKKTPLARGGFGRLLAVEECCCCCPARSTRSATALPLCLETSPGPTSFPGLSRSMTDYKQRACQRTFSGLRCDMLYLRRSSTVTPGTLCKLLGRTLRRARGCERAPDYPGCQKRRRLYAGKAGRPFPQACASN